MVNVRSLSSVVSLLPLCFADSDAHGKGGNLKDIVQKREVFYAGGQYTNVTSSSNTTSLLMEGQIYVEKLSPNPAPKNAPLPIIFIAGAAQTGGNFLDTPDGRPGWASYFLSKGHTVYLSDQPARGRSFWRPGEGTMVTIGAPSGVSALFTDAANNGNLWPQAKLHTQWPGTGRMGDPTFEQFYRAQVQFQADRFISEEQNAQAYSALVDIVGDCYVISHSQGGAYGVYPFFNCFGASLMIPRLESW